MDTIDKILSYIMAAGMTIAAIGSGILSWALLSVGTPGFVCAGIVVALAVLVLVYLAYLYARFPHT